MTEQEDTRKKSRRDLLLVLLILPLGVLCMFMTGQAAIRLAPKWVLNADMRSLLDPNAEFAAGGRPLSILPLDPNILTLPAWGDLFLTPNVTIPTRIIFTATPTPPPPRTPPPPIRFTPGDDPEPTTTGGVPIKPTPGDRQEADLQINKSDNSRTYTPGTSINYTILVKNLGPHPALTFDVIDNIPAVISGLSVNCTPANLCGNNTSSGNRIAFIGASLPFTGVNEITITVSGMVASGATGDLVNTAEIVIPGGSRYKDPNLANNIVTDTDRQLSIHDLAITKSDGSNTYEANTPINYTIVVTNSGPSDAIGIRIRDNIPAQIASWDWACTMVNATGCSGVSGSTANFNNKVTIRVGGRIEYSVRANPALLPQNPQNLTNVVRIFIPRGRTNIDPDPSNNRARDTNIPYIDLQIAKTDVPAGNTYTPGGPLTYTVTVTNASTFNLTGVGVRDNLSPMFSTWTWSCIAGPGASCTSGPPDTNINDTAVTFPPGGIVTYMINATVHANAAGTLENTATVAQPAGLVDALPGNNTATDANTGAGVPPIIGPPDGSYPPWADGGPPIIIVFGPPIVADGDVGTPDFVYYEFEDPTPPPMEVALDWIQIEISTDGASWIPVFNWGDGTPDTNSNADYNLCPTEADNCRIPFGNLYNQTGITIDVDPLVPAGSYAWIRLTAPASPGGDAPEVDAIQPYYP